MQTALTNLFLLSKLPQILDQMKAQQKEMQAQLAQLLNQQPEQMSYNVPPIQQEPQTTLQQAPVLTQSYKLSKLYTLIDNIHYPMSIDFI